MKEQTKQNAAMSAEELDMINKGVKHWQSMDVLKSKKGGLVSSETIRHLIANIVDDVWGNAKTYYESQPKELSDKEVNQKEEVAFCKGFEMGFKKGSSSSEQPKGLSADEIKEIAISLSELGKRTGMDSASVMFGVIGALKEVRDRVSGGVDLERDILRSAYEAGADDKHAYEHGGERTPFDDWYKDHLSQRNQQNNK